MVGSTYIGSTQIDDLFEQGAVVYGRWFGKTLDRNGWSHPNIVKLSKRVLGKDKGYVHSSQISALRTGTLKSPGPRSFANMVYLFHAIDDYQKGIERADAPDFTGLERLIDNAVVMRDDEGHPASIGYHFEVFCGWRQPPATEAELTFTLEDAETISKNAGKYVRSMLVAERMDLIDDLPKLQAAFSNDKKVQRLFADVVMGQGYWDVDEIDDAMVNLSQTLKTVFKEKRKAEELLKQFRA